MRYYNTIPFTYQRYAIKNHRYTYGIRTKWPRIRYRYCISIKYSPLNHFFKIMMNSQINGRQQYKTFLKIFSSRTIWYIWLIFGRNIFSWPLTIGVNYSKLFWNMSIQDNQVAIRTKGICLISQISSFYCTHLCLVFRVD